MSDENEQAAPAAAAGTETTEAPKAVTPPPQDDTPPDDPVNERKPPEDDDDGPDEGTDDKGQKRPSRTQRYKQRIAALEAELAARPRPTPRAPVRSVEEMVGPRPRMQDYTHTADYQAAVSGWEAQRRFVAMQVQERQQQEAAERQEHLDTLARRYAEMQEDARAELPDYDRVVGAARLVVSDALKDALIESDQTAKLEYFLAKNPGELAKLNRMSPTEAARAVGRLEERLSKQQQSRPTQAPTPLTRLNGGAAGPARALADLAKSDSPEDYIAARRAERAKQMRA